jgi:hypothetical protein
LFASKTAPSKQLLHRAGAGRFRRKQPRDAPISDWLVSPVLFPLFFFLLIVGYVIVRTPI